ASRPVRDGGAGRPHRRRRFRYLWPSYIVKSTPVGASVKQTAAADPARAGRPVMDSEAAPSPGRPGRTRRGPAVGRVVYASILALRAGVPVDEHAAVARFCL